MAQSHEEVFSELKWASMFHQVSIRKDPSKESIDLPQTIQSMLDQVAENSRQSVSLLLSTARQLQLLEDLLLGKDSVT